MPLQTSERKTTGSWVLALEPRERAMRRGRKGGRKGALFASVGLGVKQTRVTTPVALPNSWFPLIKLYP